MSARILYVEDDDGVRAFVETLLVGEGYDVAAVSTAEDAIAKLAQATRPFDGLLTDYNLPHHNADWMLQLAQEREFLKRTPVVILTGTDAPSGVDGYRILRKPVDIAVLLAALDETLAAQEPMPEAEEAPDDQVELRLTLYITGSSRESQRALRNLQRIVKQFDPAPIRIRVHDVTSNADEVALEDDRVVVTPTLVRTHPLPKVWAFGNLSRSEVVEEMISEGLAGASYGPGR